MQSSRCAHSTVTEPARPALDSLRWRLDRLELIDQGLLPGALRRRITVQDAFADPYRCFKCTELLVSQRRLWPLATELCAASSSR
jgi:hypothetical protein